jgi:hypothetical protein
MLGCELTEKTTKHIWRVVGGGPSASRNGMPVWVLSNVTEFSSPIELTISQIRDRFTIPKGETIEQPEPVVERPIDSLRAMTAREHRMRARLRPKPRTRTVRQYAPEDYFNDRVPEDYKTPERKIAESIADDPAKLRDFFVTGHRYSQPVHAEVANVLAERQGIDLAEVRRKATEG